jgi:riboflavin kinase/FMN adenylyltransferase
VTASSFLDMLQERLGLASLWVGEDFALGHRREGNRLFLERASQERGFSLHVVSPVKVAGEVVSSTRVREALRAGDVGAASTYLGRPFTIPGTVIRGAGRGRTLGIPTANLRVWEERAFPAAGVYACMADFAGGRWKAVTNVGFRPTFDEGNLLPIVEAHVLDFQGELYEQEMKLSFIQRLRDERRFPGPEALVAQIREDAIMARQVLDHRPEAFDV